MRPDRPSSYREAVTTLSELTSRVTGAYDRLGAPFWPDPHEGLRPPPEREYSRVTTPGRYRVIHFRARVWGGVLAGVPGVRVETLRPGRVDIDGRWEWFDRGVRITSSRPGTLPLFLLERDGRGEPGGGMSLPGLRVGVGRPEVALTILPECGCDACDDGSASLVGAVDEAVRIVISGPLVLLRATEWYARWYPGGFGAGGTAPHPDHDALAALCRRLAEGEDLPPPPGAEVFTGRSWLA